MQRAAIIFLLAAFVFAQDDVPPFLQGAPQNVIDEFRQIIATAPQHTDSEMEQLIQNWANRQTPQIAVNDFGINFFAKIFLHFQ